MYGVNGIALFCLGLLVLRAAIAGARMHPVPRWLSEDMQAYAVVPFIVTAATLGIAALGTWLFSGAWRTQTLFHWIGMAAIVVAYVLLRRWVDGWIAARVTPLTLVAETNLPQDPGRPPQRPEVKKAA